MNGQTLRWLIRDVFLRARASGLNATLLAITALTTAVCLTARQDSSGLRLLFGSVVIPGDDAARQLLFWLAFCVADCLGILVVLLGTAGFLPAFLEPAAASVLVAKPVSRCGLLLGRVFGVTVFVAVHGGLFLAATAAGVAWSTGLWLPGYFLALPLLVVQFLAFYGMSALIAVSTRSTVAAMLGSVFFCLISWGMSFGRHLLVGIQMEEASKGFGRAVEYGYWILPKPTYFSLMLHQALGVSIDGLTAVGLNNVQEMGLYNPAAAIVTSLAAGLVLLGMAVYEFQHVDY